MSLQQKIPALIKPLENNKALVALISEITGQSAEVVSNRLYHEELQPGYNVNMCLKNYRVTPHIWNNRLEQFYKESDAFLYELIAWNRKAAKIETRRWIGDYLSKIKTKPLKILSIGDGLGLDSTYLQQLGNEVVYFEFPGYSEKFARKIFEINQVPIEIITDAKKIPIMTFDIVVCLDVLEHVPLPPDFVGQIAQYLNNDGRAIISAPFSLVGKVYPTHLKSNQKYSGRWTLYTRNGLFPIEGRLLWNPIVLSKQKSKWLKNRKQIRTMKMIGLLNIINYHLGGTLLKLPMFLLSKKFLNAETYYLQDLQHE